jgi:hypothetical protein
VSNVSEEHMGAHADLHSRGQTTRFTTHFTLKYRSDSAAVVKVFLIPFLMAKKDHVIFCLLGLTHFAVCDAH